jgi:hypothetical protein
MPAVCVRIGNRQAKIRGWGGRQNGQIFDHHASSMAPAKIGTVPQEMLGLLEAP